MTSPVSLGLLYPGHAAEDDLPWLVDAVAGGAAVADVVHTSIDGDDHTVESLLDMGRADRLEDGAAELRARGASVAVWVCTSGSFVYGWDGARRQVAQLEAAFGAPASSTSLAFVRALEALGARRVAIAATYPEPVTRCFVGLLSDAGFEVARVTSNDIPTATEAGEAGREEVLALAAAGDEAGADALLVPDTALHTARWLADLEEAAGKPVLTANQVSIWEALRLAGVPASGEGFGALFARPAVAP